MTHGYIVTHRAAGNELACTKAYGAPREVGFGALNGRFELHVIAIPDERLLDELPHFQARVGGKTDARGIGETITLVVFSMVSMSVPERSIRIFGQVVDGFTCVDLGSASNVGDINLAGGILVSRLGLHWSGRGM